MKQKLIIATLSILLPIIGFSQVTPNQIDACKGVAAGQNSYSVSISCNSFPTSVYQMEKICVTYTLTNTGPATLKVNNQSPIAITLGGSALAASDIIANQPYIMIYDNIGSKWTLQKPSGSGGVAVSSVSADSPLSSSGGSTPTISITSPLPIANGGTNTTISLSAGSIIFSDGTKFTEDNSHLFWDDVSKMIGIGTNTPTATVHTISSGSTTATYTGLFQNINGDNTLALRDDGFVGVGAATPLYTGDPAAALLEVRKVLAITGNNTLNLMRTGGDNYLVYENSNYFNIVSQDITGSGFDPKMSFKGDGSRVAIGDGSAGLAQLGANTNRLLVAAPVSGVSNIIGLYNNAATGIGNAAAITMFSMSDTPEMKQSGQITSIVTDNVNATFSGDIIIQPVLNNTPTSVLTVQSNGTLAVPGIPAYANNAAAVAALGAGRLYYTDTAGEYIIKLTH
jgi:hypothetical protein